MFMQFEQFRSPDLYLETSRMLSVNLSGKMPKNKT
jgi:hypothetical protein